LVHYYYDFYSDMMSSNHITRSQLITHTHSPTHLLIFTHLTIFHPPTRATTHSFHPTAFVNHLPTHPLPFPLPPSEWRRRRGAAAQETSKAPPLAYGSDEAAALLKAQREKREQGANIYLSFWFTISFFLMEFVTCQR
jgi:hypothetical protein